MYVEWLGIGWEVVVTLVWCSVVVYWCSAVQFSGDSEAIL